MEPKLNWLQKQLDLDDQALGKMVSNAPTILRLSIEASIKPKLAWMKGTLGLDRKASAKLVVLVPSVLNIQQDTLDKKLAFLRGEDVNLSKVSFLEHNSLWGGGYKPGPLAPFQGTECMCVVVGGV